MPKFSQRSKDALKGADPRMARLLEAAIIDTPVDFTVIEALRSTKTQQRYYKQGRETDGEIITKKDGVKNKSNHQDQDGDGDGEAVDLCPFINGKLDWDNTAAFEQLAAHIKAKAKELGIRIRWGADWDNDGVTRAQGDKDEHLVDMPHFELI